jgi:hypothetical protein
MLRMVLGMPRNARSMPPPKSGDSDILPLRRQWISWPEHSNISVSEFSSPRVERRESGAGARRKTT